MLNVVLVEKDQENGKVKEKPDRLGAIEARCLNTKARDMKAFHLICDIKNRSVFWRFGSYVI